MNRKTSKLLRGFCKVTNQPYRAMKRAYTKMKPLEKEAANKHLFIFWQDNKAFLDHKKYYDLKKPLQETLPNSKSQVPLSSSELAEIERRTDEAMARG